MNILLALDGSPNAGESIKAMEQFYDGPSTRVHLVVVCDPAVITPHAIAPEQAAHIIDQAERSIKSAYSHATVSSEMLTGNPQSQIIDSLEAFKADLVMAGAHAPRPFPNSLLGSVATHLARHADCQVKLLRRGCSDNRTMVCLDRSSVDKALIETVKATVWKNEDELLLFSALDLPVGEYSENPKEDARLFAKMQEEQELILHGEIELLREVIKGKHPHIAVDIAISKEIEVVDTILHRAQHWQAGTLMVGSHRRRGLERLWLGSVSEALAQRAPCSVHIVRAKHQP